MAELKRELGFWDVFCIASGAMISSGLFVLPGLAFKHAGPGVVLSYALGGILMIPAMLSQAELATAMPQSGGSYFFIERSMGALPGVLAGLANWFSIALKSAFALIGIGAFARLIWGPSIQDWMIKSIAIAFCLGFTSLNLFSVKHVGRLQMIMVAALFAVLLMFLGLGLPQAHAFYLEGFLSKGCLGILGTAGLVFVSYGGLTKVASVAGEIRNPGRNIPGGMFAASIIVSFLYVGAVFVMVSTLPPGKIHDPDSGRFSLTPLSLTASEIIGQWGMIVVSLAAMLAFFTTANGGILSASRSPMAMSRDGLLPEFFRSVSKKFNTPYVSILLTSGFMILVVAALPIEALVKVASTMMLMLFVLVNVAVLIMRSSKLQNYRPLFRTPCYPWIQVSGIVAYLILIAGMGLVPLITTAIFAVGGVLWYVVYVRQRISRESAFVYMVRNLVSKKMRRGRLEEELREIALERDQVTHDRFDRLIADCVILDINEPIPAKEMFTTAAAELAPRTGLSEEILLERFLEREKQSSTIVKPGVAIPHVIVPGEDRFDIVLVRCKQGIKFSEVEEPVHTAFILIGSPDERNYHLRALMAIAHIVEEHRFTERWLAAPEQENLRDILLLSGRCRNA